MSNYAHTRSVLSASTNGRPIKLTTTTGSGDTIHTVSATSGVMEEVWLWASNTSASAVQLTVYFGGTTSPDDEAHYSIPAHSTELVVPGWTLQSGLAVKGKPGTTAVLNITGHVNVLTPK